MAQLCLVAILFGHIGMNARLSVIDPPNKIMLPEAVFGRCITLFTQRQLNVSACMLVVTSSSMIQSFRECFNSTCLFATVTRFAYLDAMMRVFDSDFSWIRRLIDIEGDPSKGSTGCQPPYLSTCTRTIKYYVRQNRRHSGQVI